MKNMFIAILLAAGMSFGQSTSYLHKGQLGPYHRDVLAALGDRLETPGKERLVLSGVTTKLCRKLRSFVKSVAINSCPTPYPQS